jgi:hypothetical protein
MAKGMCKITHGWGTQNSACVELASETHVEVPRSEYEAKGYHPPPHCRNARLSRGKGWARGKDEPACLMSFGRTPKTNGSSRCDMPRRRNSAGSCDTDGQFGRALWTAKTMVVAE